HNAATHDFVLSYRALFNTEPGSFAFQGYDIGTYFISALVKYGPKFIQKCVDLKMNLMQSNASFIRVEGGGLQNIGTKDIVYGPGYAIN
ncbi:MAG: hypothetical protein HUJ93_00375, partial [Bacteroidales bacterium]|nr:hypothetical protein [Bacteroidales bacterium]